MRDNNKQSLSELIKACGLNFALQGDEKNWVAQRYGKERINAYGATPEEAVANLLLKLNV